VHNDEENHPKQVDSIMPHILRIPSIKIKQLKIWTKHPHHKAHCKQPMAESDVFEIFEDC